MPHIALIWCKFVLFDIYVYFYTFLLGCVVLVWPALLESCAHPGPDWTRYRGWGLCEIASASPTPKSSRKKEKGPFRIHPQILRKYKKAIRYMCPFLHALIQHSLNSKYSIFSLYPRNFLRYLIKKSILKNFAKIKKAFRFLKDMLY